MLENNPALISALIRKKRRIDAENDIEYFASYYLGHILENKTPAFHVEIRQMLFKYNRLGIAAPRGFAKSTNVQIIYAIYCLLFHRLEDILSISQSADMAEDWVRKIKFELEGNERIKEDFAPILRWGEKESKRWTASHLVIQDADGRVFSQIRARGRGCQVRGLRPTKVFCDDLEDEEMVRSEEQRKYLKEWFLGALLNVLKNDQQLVFIGTILHPLSLIADLINKKEQFGDWKTKKYKALVDGKSLWPDRFSAEDLENRRKAIGMYAFESEFQNNPIASDICLWKPEWLQRWNPSLEKPIFIRKFAALDIAATEKQKGDYSSLCCIGETEDNKFYEIETLRGHWGTWELVKKIIEFYKRHNPIKLGIEEQNMYQILRPILYREARLAGLKNFHVEALGLGNYSDNEKESKTPRDKYTRALTVIHFWENGQVFIRSEELYEEMSVFPTGSHDDMVDSIVYAMRMFLKYGAKAEFIATQENRVAPSSFEIKDGQMPNIYAEMELEQQRQAGNDWRVGG